MLLHMGTYYAIDNSSMKPLNEYPSLYTPCGIMSHYGIKSSYKNKIVSQSVFHEKLQSILKCIYDVA